MSDPTTPRRSAYYQAVEQADDDVKEALQAVRDEEDAGRLTVRQAADERVRLLEAHLKRCAELRRVHLGDPG
jgi:hypothetical protein